MGSVWLCIPSKRPPEEAEPVLKLWRERGYKIALVVDSHEEAVARMATVNAIISSREGYRGYARSVNALIYGIRTSSLTNNGKDAEWFVAAGDDVEPDMNHSAEEIAAQLQGYFTKQHYGNEAHHAAEIGPLSTFGVMQPTGDRWGDSAVSRQRYGQNRGAYIDRVCGSAWIGREFARRVNKGNGPLWPEYFHMFVDEELQEIALRNGVLWQRPDLSQLHRHWGRAEGNKPGDAAKMPAHLTKANAQFDEARKLFDKRKAASFPGAELL